MLPTYLYGTIPLRTIYLSAFIYQFIPIITPLYVLNCKYLDYEKIHYLTKIMVKYNIILLILKTTTQFMNFTSLSYPLIWKPKKKYWESIWETACIWLLVMTQPRMEMFSYLMLLST